MWWANIPGTLMDEWRRALLVGYLSARDSIKGPWGRARLVGNPKDVVFERYAKCLAGGPLSS
jgi:hypothetical protein